jgi:hypothetical protein
MPTSSGLPAQTHPVSLPDRFFWVGLLLVVALALGHIELGNFALGRGEKQKALDWYELAQKDSAQQPDILMGVERPIQIVSNAPPGTVPPLRNPAKE